MKHSALKKANAIKDGFSSSHTGKHQTEAMESEMYVTSPGGSAQDRTIQVREDSKQNQREEPVDTANITQN